MADKDSEGGRFQSQAFKGVRANSKIQLGSFSTTTSGWTSETKSSAVKSEVEKGRGADSAQTEKTRQKSG